MMTTEHADRRPGVSATLDDMRAALSEHGLHVLGVAPVQPGELDSVPNAEKAVRTLFLVGNAGSSMWAAFSSSPEHRDGLPDALDRWSLRVGEHIAGTLGLRVYYPFGGPPHYPFQRWAERATQVHASPLRLQIHPEFGLWHAYRFALGSVTQLPRMTLPAATASACTGCAGQPCLPACPVHAFGDGYDADACVAHLQAYPAGACATQGCAARRACPVGAAYRYRPAHAQFHMRAFATAAGRCG